MRALSSNRLLRCDEQAYRDPPRRRHQRRRLPGNRLGRTAAQAGAGFGFQLVWAILLGTIAIAFIVEMAGRFVAAVSRHTLSDAIRERFGFDFFVWPLVATLRPGGSGQARDCEAPAEPLAMFIAECERLTFTDRLPTIASSCARDDKGRGDCRLSRP
jgi:hypothetical protein